jgi:succinyl-diaminopimelate desuccinylase
MLSQKELKVLNYVESSRGELVERVKEFVKIPTVNPPGEHYEEMAEVLARRLNEIGLEVEVISVPKEELSRYSLELPRYVVVGVLRGKEGGRKLLLNGHYDVVPAGHGWSTDPFQPIVRDGRIYGRGSADMKGAIASMITAVKAIKESNIVLKGDLYLTFVPDEEIGGHLGSGYLVKNKLISGDACVIGEPTNAYSLVTAQKGALWLELVTHGKAAHGSMPHLGINAVEKMAMVIVAFEKLKNEFAKYKSRIKFPEPVRHTTINIGGVIKGGTKINVVPDTCSCTLDIRVIPEETTESVEKRVREFLEELKKEVPELNYELRVVDRIEPALTLETEEIVKVCREAIAGVTGREPSIEGLTGFTDMRWFKELMPTIIYGPGSMEQAHVANEYVEIDKLVISAKVYSLTIMKFLGYM